MARSPLRVAAMLEDQREGLAEQSTTSISAKNNTTEDIGTRRQVLKLPFRAYLAAYIVELRRKMLRYR
jgi:hypothetical protein